MRVDLFLKISRLCPRRSIAQKLCDAGLVSVNGKITKSAHPVKPNDEIIIHRRRKITTVRVLSLPDGKQASRHDASNLYEIVSEHDDLEPV